MFRIQLTTSNLKQDTYYAEYNNTLYFVKGPFPNRKIIDDFIAFQQIKNENGIPYMENVYCLLIEPDRWNINEIPLGYRRSIDITKKYPFMIAKSVIPKDKLVTRVHSSKLWPPTVVLDDKATEGSRIKISKLEGQLMIDFLNIVALRLLHNIGDIVERNFMLVNNRVLSVDEEFTQGKSVSLLDCLKKTNYHIVKTVYPLYRGNLSTKIVEILDKEFK